MQLELVNEFPEENVEEFIPHCPRCGLKMCLVEVDMLNNEISLCCPSPDCNYSGLLHIDGCVLCHDKKV